MCDFAADNLFENWRVSVPPCAGVDGEWVPQGGAPRCIVVRTGDALDPRCAEEGSNVELELRTTAPDPPGPVYRAGCWLSPNPHLDCPRP
ncbi:hypothetical protein [Nannocystis exedens]|uniref:hypothetical protein n=1 Tax=Nannocystis exedens TaxID=54 RepID=UPI0011603C7E|nr:hypothetical protein [Nannocystis exedens]